MVTKAQKTKTVDELKASLLKAKLTVVSDYQGTTVSELTQLRREIQNAGGEFTVAKNTLVKRALEGHSSSSVLEAFLKGPTAVIHTEGDPVPVAKAVTEYIKKVKKTQIKGGVLEGKKITNEDLKSISSLPSKEVLIAKMLGSMNAPAQNVVYALSGVSRNLVYALEAIRKQKEAQG
jgi:large subunit ribosomal protein L10